MSIQQAVSDWITKYKHLSGKHNQRLHGRRDGAGPLQAHARDLANVDQRATMDARADFRFSDRRPLAERTADHKTMNAIDVVRSVGGIKAALKLADAIDKGKAERITDNSGRMVDSQILRAYAKHLSEVTGDNPALDKHFDSFSVARNTKGDPATAVKLWVSQIPDGQKVWAYADGTRFPGIFKRPSKFVAGEVAAVVKFQEPQFFWNEGMKSSTTFGWDDLVRTTEGISLR